tara:strand:+ start:778 stop:978 length:201 start_codon:yes stop_codon:yes gene_type:complete
MRNQRNQKNQITTRRHTGLSVKQINNQKASLLERQESAKKSLSTLMKLKLNLKKLRGKSKKLRRAT